VKFEKSISSPTDEYLALTGSPLTRFTAPIAIAVGIPISIVSPSPLPLFPAALNTIRLYFLVRYFHLSINALQFVSPSIDDDIT
jgi:hypothetical protein